MEATPINTNKATIPVTIREILTKELKVDVYFPAFYKSKTSVPGTEDKPGGYNSTSYFKFDSISRGVCITIMETEDPRDKPVFSVKAVPQGLMNDRYVTLLTHDDFKSNLEEFQNAIIEMNELINL